MQTVNYSDYIYYAGTTQPVVRVPVYVYEANTENLALLYDGSGAAIDNPTKTDDNGLFDFWVEFGKYDIYVHNTKEYSVSLLTLAYFYLGIYDANPTERPDGSAIQDGDMYFNSVINHTKLYNNGLWYYADDMMNASGVAYDPASGPQTDVQTQMRAYDTHLDTIDAHLDAAIINTNVAISDDTNASDLGYDSINMVKGGSFTVASGKTLTIDVPFSAGLYQVFSGAGSVVFGAGLVTEVYPQWWGAVGDGVTDDTAAIAAAIQYVTTPVNSIYCRGLYWPDGQYLVTQNNWIGENLSVAGVYGGRLDTIFQGSGRNSAVIIFKPTVADAACYDQTLTPTALLNGFKVQNLGFKFDNTANGSQPIHFIRSKAEPSMASQNWRLNDTKFIGVTGSRLFWLQGSVNEDVISVYDTTTNTFENIVYAESNIEALMHSFYSLDCLNQLGSIFKYNKGGALQVDTLNAIMTGTNGVDTGVFELLDGTTTRIYTFNNVRCELRGANTRLLLVPVTSANTIAFKNCEVAAVINSQAWAKVIVQSHCTISFKDCIFPRPDYTVTGALGTKGTLQLTDSTSGSDYTITDASRSYIIFENCSYTGDRLAAVDPWVDFTLLDPAYVNFRSVQVSYRGCTNIPDMVEYGFPYRQSRSYVTEAPAKMIMRGDTFPQGDGVSAPLTRTGDFNVVIPLNNFVTEIVVMRKALTTAATNYQIEFIDQAERDAPGTGVIFGTTTAVPNNMAIAQRVPILRLFNGTKAQRTIWARMAAGFTLGASVGTPSDGGIYVEVL